MGIFNKPEAKKPSTTPAPPRNKPAPSPPAGNPATLIGPAAQIKGELMSSDNLHIEGKVEGKVKSGKQVVIGEKGQVQAEVEAEVVSIRGRLEGDCHATNKVEITSTGKVYGNISAPRISVVEGAVFRGASHMTSEQKHSESASVGRKKSESLPSQETTEPNKDQAHPPGANPKP